MDNFGKWINEHYKEYSTREKFFTICMFYSRCHDNCPFREIDGACDWNNPQIKAWLEDEEIEEKE